MSKSIRKEDDFYIGSSDGKVTKEKSTDIKDTRAEEILQLPKKTWFSNH